MTVVYTLKDMDTQLALEELFPGFGKALSDAHFCHMDAGLARLFLTPKNGDVPWVLLVPEKAVTTRTAYEPGVWNEPDVIPPEGVPMCVEMWCGDSRVFRRLGTYRDGKWHIDDYPRGFVHVEVKRFRSWE